MLLSYEEASFYKLLLQTGFEKDVNKFIDLILENNDTLEGINLDLVSNQGDINSLISCLHNYIGDNIVDDKTISDRLRLFIKDKVDKDELSVEEAVNALYGFVCISEKYHDEFWHDFYLIGEDYEFYYGKDIEKTNFLNRFYHYIETGEKFKIDYPVGRLSFKELLKKEKEEMNKIRAVVNYTIVPISLVIIFSILITNLILLTINEERYTTLAIILFIIVGIILISLLISSFFVRKKEIKLELSKYDFTVDKESKKEYIIKNTEGTAFVFNELGIIFNEKLYEYDDIAVMLCTNNHLSKVNIFISFHITKVNKYIKPYFLIRLDKDLVNVIKKFNIKFSNKDQKNLDYILNNKEEAFKQIITYGYIKKNK